MPSIILTSIRLNIRPYQDHDYPLRKTDEIFYIKCRPTHMSLELH